MARGGVIQFRVSAEERARIEVRAAEAGLDLSAFVRARALGGAVGQAQDETPRSRGVDAPDGAGMASSPVSGSRKSAGLEVGEESPARPGPTSLQGALRPAPAEPLFGCPMHGCRFKAGSGKARCPDHGRTVVSL